MALTPTQQAAVLAGIAANRVFLPPGQIQGLGQPQVGLQPAVWGGMGMVTPVPQTFGTANSKVVLFDNPFPLASTGLVPEGCYFDTPNDEIIVLQRGVYLFSLIMAGTIPAGADFQFTIALNGVATRIAIGAGASNQTAGFYAGLSAMGVLANDGDVVSLLGKADQAGRVFTATEALMQLLRVR